MNVTRVNHGSHSVVTVTGRLDTETAGAFEETCGRWIDEGSSRLVFDFSTLFYVSSAGLRALFTVAKKASKEGGAVAAFGASGSVQDVFHFASFEEIVPMAADAAAALGLI
jgi:anti-sigma B factor antagonist